MPDRKVEEEVVADSKKLKGGIKLKPGHKTVVVVTDRKGVPPPKEDAKASKR